MMVDEKFRMIQPNLDYDSYVRDLYRIFVQSSSVIIGAHSLHYFWPHVRPHNWFVLSRNRSTGIHYTNVDHVIERLGTTKCEVLVLGGVKVYRSLMPFTDEIVLLQMRNLYAQERPHISEIIPHELLEVYGLYKVQHLDSCTLYYFFRQNSTIFNTFKKEVEKTGENLWSVVYASYVELHRLQESIGLMSRNLARRLCIIRPCQ